MVAVAVHLGGKSPSDDACAGQGSTFHDLPHFFWQDIAKFFWKGHVLLSMKLSCR